jgi:RNA polymerase sigma-70 factor (ECF subfamily)
MPVGSLGRIRAGADAARASEFADFVATHRERAVALAWRLVGGDTAAAEDVAQEAFLRAHRGLRRFRDEATLSTWFYRILLNEAHRHVRWRWVRQRVTGEMPQNPIDPRPQTPGDPMLRERVALALAGLPRGQREAFVLVYLEGWSVTEAARMTGRAVGTLKSHLHRALAALREGLADLNPQDGATRS